jgi:hypothetical protein
MTKNGVVIKINLNLLLHKSHCTSDPQCASTSVPGKMLPWII